jgi:hypothetical protein
MCKMLLVTVWEINMMALTGSCGFLQRTDVPHSAYFRMSWISNNLWDLRYSDDCEITDFRDMTRCSPVTNMLADVSENVLPLLFWKWDSLFLRNVFKHLPDHRSRDKAVGRAPGCQQDDRGVGVRVLFGSRIFSSPRRPDRHWGPPSVVFSRYWEFFPRG